MRYEEHFCLIHHRIRNSSGPGGRNSPNSLENVLFHRVDAADVLPKFLFSQAPLLLETLDPWLEYQARYVAYTHPQGRAQGHVLYAQGPVLCTQSPVLCARALFCDSAPGTLFCAPGLCSVFPGLHSVHSELYSVCPALRSARLDNFCATRVLFQLKSI